MEKFFKLKEHGTTVRTEVMAGITTFMTMAYILAVNPGILSAAGMPAGGVFTATALASLIATLCMALLSNLPIALAPGMGLNAFFAFAVVLGMGYSWQLALTAVFVEGVIFILMSLFNIREAIVRSIPANIKSAVSVGIGLFIAFIGLQNAGLVVNNDATLVGLGNITKGAPLLALIGLVIMGVLLIFKVKGALLIGILATTIIDLGRLSERDIRRGRKIQGKTGQPLGAVLLSQAEIPEGELLAAVRARAFDEICALFTTDLSDVEFIEHTAEEKLEEF
ncbi:MAG TPA: NCS2 family permease, partial [Spirochaetia bacterium]|nr:NCS2 family permease [Spirochaetia bacterium]